VPSSKAKRQLIWSDVKAKLANFDRAGLVELVQDLYSASKDNRAFLHARFSLSGDTLGPYKAIIARWLWPDVIRNQDTSVARAKRAIADYSKAIGHPEGLAELVVFYCEQAAGFSNDIGLQDESYFNALVRMFARAVTAANALSSGQRDPLLGRLDQVRRVSHNFGYGVGDDMDEILSEYDIGKA
jgi:hypothetical protein